jgi:hypothetical protein
MCWPMILAAIALQGGAKQASNNAASNSVAPVDLGSGFQQAKPQAGASTNAGGALSLANDMAGGGGFMGLLKKKAPVSVGGATGGATPSLSSDIG